MLYKPWSVFVFKDAGLQPYLDQINVIEEQVAALEQAAYKLDAYSKKLGNHFFLFWFDKSTLLPVWPYMIVNIYSMPTVIYFNLIIRLESNFLWLVVIK